VPHEFSEIGAEIGATRIFCATIPFNETIEFMSTLMGSVHGSSIAEIGAEIGATRVFDCPC
jgi:hypothetical protein